LNADEVAALTHARSAGVSNFTVSADWMSALAQAPSNAVAARLAATFLAGEARPELLRTLSGFIGNNANRGDPAQRLRTALIALLQTPDYQLC
jgi:hypothetical protein